MDKELTVTKMTKNNSKCPKESLLKLSVQAQKFEISMQKAWLGVRSLWGNPYTKLKVSLILTKMYKDILD